MLTLLDIDGTLVTGTPVAHGLALCAALADVYGVTVTHDELVASLPAGKTDRQIARGLLVGRGLTPEAAEAGLGAWCRAAVSRYRLLAGHHPHPVAVPDAGRALGRLAAAGAEVAVVTGNIREIAHDKLRRTGLGALARPGAGGFGDESEERADLVRNAIARSGADPSRTVVIGDTPFDVAAARGAGCRVVAVTTGRHTAADLAGADDVAGTLSDAAACAVRLLDAAEARA